MTYIFDFYYLLDMRVILTYKLYILSLHRSDMSGFYKSNYSDADGNKKVMASTQFEALDARRYDSTIELIAMQFMFV